MNEMLMTPVMQQTDLEFPHLDQAADFVYLRAALFAAIDPFASPC